MKKRIFSLALASFLFITGINPVRAVEADTIVISLDPASWIFASDTDGSKEDASLRIASRAESAWATPKGRWPSANKLELRIDGAAEGGRLVAQAEWFDRSGQLVVAQEITSLSGAETPAQVAPLTAPEGASSFGIKLWIEGSPANAILRELRIERVPDWPTPVANAQRIDPENTKLETDSGLSVEKSGSSWSMVLSEGTKFASAHLDFPVKVKSGTKILLPVLEVPQGALISMQILSWGQGRIFLGPVEAIKDVTEAGDYEFILPESATTGNPTPTEFTTKIWVDAPPGQTVRVGAPIFAESPGAP